MVLVLVRAASAHTVRSPVPLHPGHGCLARGLGATPCSCFPPFFFFLLGHIIGFLGVPGGSGSSGSTSSRSFDPGRCPCSWW